MSWNLCIDFVIVGSGFAGEFRHVAVTPGLVGIRAAFWWQLAGIASCSRTSGLFMRTRFPIAMSFLLPALCPAPYLQTYHNSHATHLETLCSHGPFCLFVVSIAMMSSSLGPRAALHRQLGGLA